MRKTDLRTRLLKYFMLFSILSVTSFIMLTISLYLKMSDVSDRSMEYESLSNHLKDYFESSNSFIIIDAQNMRFHRTKGSHFLKRRVELRNLLVDELTYYQNTEDEGPYLNILREIEEKTDLYESVFRNLLTCVKERGVEQFGHVGQMHIHARELESSDLLRPADVMLLRRFEKDYLIRRSPEDITLVEEQLEKMCEEVMSNDRVHPDLVFRDELLLNAYAMHFHQIVTLDQDIGLQDESNLFAKLKQIEMLTYGHLGAMHQEIHLKNDEAKSSLVKAYVKALLVFILLSLLFSSVVSRHITKPISFLSQAVEEFVKGGFRSEVMPDLEMFKDRELWSLGKNFWKVRTEISSHINRLNFMVKERTMELTTEKERLVQKSQEINDSLVYAGSIQRSLLHGEQTLKAILQNSFLMSKPQNIVSGDFFWVHRAGKVGSHDERILFAVGDCTGHGVPACLLSLVCFNTLNELIYEKPELGPSGILDQVNERLSNISLNVATRNHEGMCISLCEYRPAQRILKFSGSFQSISILRKKESVHLKGDRTYIEIGKKKLYCPKFSEYEAPLYEGDMIYLYSDGFIDQFGGHRKKKLKSSGFHELLCECMKVHISKQSHFLHSALNNWMGDIEQIDDISVLGIRVESTVNQESEAAE